MKTSSQNQKILEYLKKGNSLTPMKAFAFFNCLRLSARIHNLREQGHRIDSRMISKNGKHFAEYTL